LINAWYCPTYPWESLDCEAEVRELLEERIKLIPMLKRAFDEYKTTGKPPIRALVMDYTDDTATYSIDDEYIFCDELLVAPIPQNSADRRNVYMPAGEWCDYWTGETYQSGWHKIETTKIPVFKKLS
jgi:alpha-D-xyloside xylohydrolase